MEAELYDNENIRAISWYEMHLILLTHQVFVKWLSWPAGKDSSKIPVTDPVCFKAT